MQSWVEWCWSIGVVTWYLEDPHVGGTRCIHVHTPDLAIAPTMETIHMGLCVLVPSSTTVASVFCRVVALLTEAQNPLL